MSTTNYLGLNIPDKNSKGRVVTDVFEPNFTKIDQNAEIVDMDKNAIWGGEYGGYIQDTSVTKVVGKRYIDQFDKKAYICRVAGSHVNTTANYEECNVVNNLKPRFVSRYFIVAVPYTVGQISKEYAPILEGYKILGCTTSCRIAEYDIEQHPTWQSAQSEISYSLNLSNGLFKLATVESKGSHADGRVCDVTVHYERIV